MLAQVYNTYDSPWICLMDFSFSVFFIQIPIGFPTKNEQFFDIGGTKWLFEIDLESVQEGRRCNKLSLNIYLDNSKPTIF